MEIIFEKQLKVTEQIAVLIDSAVCITDEIVPPLLQLSTFIFRILAFSVFLLHSKHKCFLLYIALRIIIGTHYLLVDKSG